MTTDNADDPYAKIRPYHDDEVAPVLTRLAECDEFLDTITRYRMPRLSKRMPGLARRLVSFGLKRKMRGVESVQGFQQHIAYYMNQMLERSVDEFVVEGLDALEGDTAYLFFGNHRDIALDPAFVNYALYLQGRNTVRIAIGDNLLQKPYVTDLMRLNKSFVVPRSAKGKRAMLAAYQMLSGYIRHSITRDNHSVWLAQREGRAKNGVDRTDNAIIKMLSMAARQGDKGLSLAGAINELRIVPVSISYEFDPCDVQKARELKAVDDGQSYEKKPYEDILSIASGISGYKGRVKLVFGTPIVLNDETVDIADHIDAQVLDNYTLFPSHYLALEASGQAPELIDTTSITDADRATFNARLAEVPAELRPWWLCQYANPVLNKHGRL
ncbi:1-acyl-sn-glycerol-3-phosphate acyltransferase [Larsenimonas suaedae]|uniref:1-acyl-sn-glycerol-3-phosphate acyltransferase n=1 Tax=Larsenimonas suaedae TaxID=1851019 RepID=A0ABU1GVC4_9GAMM|nr:1-acyl-sn-glycerol-3-phosphate acyltransferase [Larsenimonas suaedae]MCM2971071.1 1-acyl-sn-glycerol-3-phosphate acyltransferase [Larsenimonas suaedae]MDR5895780.1 1-acyl-sn-glycerol-3-phosphate acyltransferase [Larsenimonas suaedae]